MVSPAFTGRGNFQFSHSHSATEGTGMSMVPRPIATATSRAGGANRAPAWATSIARGEKSPATAEKGATSVSEMVRRRVVHSPPRGRSSKEIGSRSGASISGSEFGPRALTYDDLVTGEGFLPVIASVLLFTPVLFLIVEVLLMITLLCMCIIDMCSHDKRV